MKLQGRLAAWGPLAGAALLLLILLAAVAVLQYRWIEELRDAGRRRLRADLENAGRRMVDDFDESVSRAFAALRPGQGFNRGPRNGAGRRPFPGPPGSGRQSMGPPGFPGVRRGDFPPPPIEGAGEGPEFGPPGTRPGPPGGNPPRRVPLPRTGDPVPYAGRFDNWITDAPDPKWAKNFYLIRHDASGQLLLWSYPRDKRHFERQEWPASLANVRSRLEQGPLPPSMVGPQDHPDPLLVAPGLPAALAGEAGQDWLVVELDAAYLTSTVLPALWRRNFGEGGEFAGEVRRMADGAVLFQSGGGAGDQPDLAYRLFEVRAELLPGRGGAGGGPPPPPRRAVANGAPTEIAANSGPRGFWELRLRHRAGSLDAAVDGMRRRNIALSLGILLLLAGAMATLGLAARRAQQLGAAQMEFAAGVSHELRTPLAVLASAGDNLAEGVVTDPAQVKKYGTLVRTESRRLAALVEDVLTFTGTRLGSATVEKIAQPVAPIIEQAIEACQWELQQSGCTLDRQLDTEARVEADARLLLHAVRNLISNASHHARDGKWVGVRLWSEGGRVRIEVADCGPGIDTSEQEKIFEPFYRGRRAREGHVRGTGLGLSLVRRIAQVHGGDISVTSPPGQGSRFLLDLPSYAG